MGKRKIIKTFTYIVISITILLLPLFAARIVTISKYNWMVTNNDWIGFWGGYLGGAITLLGVILTIVYTKESEKNRQKLAIRPYINIENLYNSDINNYTSVPVGFTINGAVNRRDDYSLRINNLIILCEIKNVGLGTAINSRIEKFFIEKKSYNLQTRNLPALQVDGRSYIRIELTQVDLQKRDLSTRFLNENRTLHEQVNKQVDSKVIIKFVLNFEDLLGNKLIQEYSFFIQIMLDIPVILDDRTPLFIESISKPIEC